MKRARWMVPVLTAALVASGCSTIKAVKKAKKAVEEEDVAISLTAEGDQAVLETLAINLAQHEVQTYVEIAETGARVLRLVGTIVALKKAIGWMIKQGLALFANDETAAAILGAVLKSA